jgi:hypothetical protein
MDGTHENLLFVPPPGTRTGVAVKKPVDGATG